MPAPGRVRSVLARPTPSDGSRVQQYEPDVALAVARIAELRRLADQWRLACRVPAEPEPSAGMGRPGRRAAGRGGCTARGPGMRCGPPLPTVPVGPGRKGRNS